VGTDTLTLSGCTYTEDTTIRGGELITGAISSPNSHCKEKTTMQPQQPSAAGVPPVVESRAVAYYRQSLQDQQEDSIPVQRERIREWADDHGIEIVREYADGPSLPEESQDE
jgi:hypothetical protein